MKSLIGTRTEKNLMHSFAGESQARMRYNYFASAAKKEGYEQVAAIFEETANQEKEHAKRMFKFLEGGALEISAAFPAGRIGRTDENLRAAAEGEHEEWSAAYPAFADKADEEGFAEMLERVEGGTMFKNGTPVAWRCRNCGFVTEAPEAPEKCPACEHPRDWFERLGENF